MFMKARSSFHCIPFQFLRVDVLYASRFQHEFSTAFEAAEVQRMRKALEDGEAFLEKEWHYAGDIKKRLASEKKRIEKVIRSIITRKKASDALYM